MAVDGSKRRADTGSRQSSRNSVGSGRSGTSRNGRLAFTIFSNRDEAHQIQKQILAAAEKNGITGEDFFALHIAVEEALMNAIKHGNRMDPKKKIHVEAHLTPGRAEISIEDEGPGFDRSSVPDPTLEDNLYKCSGRGILLIEAYMSSVKWDRGGRRLKMVRENK